jgi:hypothetical protein
MEFGWHGYFLSLMFSQIPGSDASRMVEMKKHLGWFYGRLAKASVPKASSSEWSEFLPKMVLAPDLPVPKHSKVKLRDVTINDGLHWHGLMFGQPVGSQVADESGPSYQRKSAQISRRQHTANRREDDHSRTGVYYQVRPQIDENSVLSG